MDAYFSVNDDHLVLSYCINSINNSTEQISLFIPHSVMFGWNYSKNDKLTFKGGGAVMNSLPGHCQVII